MTILGTRISATLAAFALFLLGCGDGGNGTNPASCDENPLRTGLTAEQTGVSVDAFDCAILESASVIDSMGAVIDRSAISRREFAAPISVQSNLSHSSIGPAPAWSAARC